jgi:hypothetical protein
LRFVSLAHYLIARPEPRPKRHFVVELRRRSVKAERRLSFILGIGYATLGEKVFQDELPLVAFPLEGGQNLEAAALLGRIVNVGRLGGMTGEFNFDLHALKRIDYIGVTFRTRSLDEIREINRLMRGRQALLADLRYLPPRRYRRGPRAHALKPAFRQDRDFHRMR